jgi:hypothetical protein
MSDYRVKIFFSIKFDNRKKKLNGNSLKCNVKRITIVLASSQTLKQQAAGRHVAPLGHILTVIQTVFDLTP